MAEHEEILSMLATVERLHRATQARKFTDEETGRLAKRLRKEDSADIKAAEEPLCDARYFPKYHDVIKAVEDARAKRLGQSNAQSSSYDAGPAPADENLAKIRRKIGPVKFASWFRNASVSIDGKIAVVQVPNRAAVDWINKGLAADVCTALAVNDVKAVLTGATR